MDILGMCIKYMKWLKRPQINVVLDYVGHATNINTMNKRTIL
jgi:hypothetical protein